MLKSIRTSAGQRLLDDLRRRLQPLKGDSHDYDSLLDLIGPARFALLGEASHGTREFYHERAEITKRLITEQHFTAIAVEADWPDAWRVNRYVRGLAGDADATAAHLGDASATEKVDRSEWNVGELMRDRYENDAVLVGFSTHRGWVTAASDWDEPPQRNRAKNSWTAGRTCSTARESIASCWHFATMRDSSTGQGRCMGDRRSCGNLSLRHVGDPR
jgi:erythromycin esterase-like protein